MADSEHTLSHVARETGVTAQTLKRWVRAGIIPQYDGSWSGAALAQARLVGRLRARGHSIEEIKRGVESGQLAFGYIEELLPPRGPSLSLEEAARETGLEPALIQRIHSTMGFGAAAVESVTEDELEVLRYSAAVLAAGFPLVAFLQMARVYGQAIAQIADAEVRLFHLYVHEPLMRDGVGGPAIAEEMEGLARDLLPLAAPIIERLHGRFLAQFVEQDIIGHMETDLEQEALDLGRLRVAIAFVDLAGYTRLTEEQGDEQAVDVVERFIESVEHTLPEEARVIKSLGDEVMVVSSDPTALTEWAVGFQTLYGIEPPLPRIGIHFGEALYRDGDYYGSEVNRAARVVARAAGGEVLVTSRIVDLASEHLEFELIGEVKLKGFNDPTQLYLARAIEDSG